MEATTGQLTPSSKLSLLCRWVGFTGHKCSQKNRVSHSVGCFSTLSSLGSVRETTLSFGGKDCAGWPELSRRKLKIWLRTPGACQPHRRPSLGVAYASTRRSPRWGSAMLSSRFPGAYAAWLLTVVPLGLGGRTRWRLACRLCWHILVTHTFPVRQTCVPEKCVPVNQEKGEDHCVSADSEVVPPHRGRGSPGAFAMEIQPLLPAPGEHSPSILPKKQPQRIGAANSDRKVVGSFQRRFHGGMELRPDESPGCCSGCPECSCCGSPSGNWTLRCSSYRPGSPGSSLMTTYRQ